MNKTLLLGSVGGLVVAGGVGAYVLLDLSPKEQYFKAEIDNQEKLVEQFKTDYQHELDYFSLFKKESYENSGEYSLNLELGDDVLAMAGKDSEKYFDLAERLSLKVDNSKNLKKNQITGGLSLLLDGKPLASGEIAVSEKEIAAKVPFLFDQHFVVKTDKFGDIARLLDSSYKGQETLDLKPLFDSLKEESPLNEKLIEELKDDYVKFAFDSINDDSVTEEKVQYKGKKAKNVTLSLSEREIKSLLAGTLEKAKKDERLINLYTEQAITSYQGAALISGETPSKKELDKLKKEFKEDFTTSLDEAIENIDDLNVGKGFTSTITLVDGDIVARHFNITIIDEENSSGVHFDYKNEQDGEKGKAVLTFNNTDANGKPIKGDKGTITDNYTFERKNGGFETKHTIKVADKEEISTFGFNYVRTAKKDVLTNNVTFQIINVKDAPQMNGFALNVSSETKFKNKNYETKTTVSSDLSTLKSMPLNAKISVTSKATTLFTEKTSYPTFNDKNSVYLHKLTPEDMERIPATMRDNLMNFYLENEELFGELTDLAGDYF